VGELWARWENGRLAEHGGAIIHTIEPTAGDDDRLQDLINSIANDPANRTVARRLEWVATTRRDANRVAFDAGIDDDQPVYVVQVIGGQYRSARGGPARSGGPSTARVLMLVVSTDTLKPLDQGYLPRQRDLSPLGVVQHVSLKPS
jgi:hypothetical protein